MKRLIKLFIFVIATSLFGCLHRPEPNFVPVKSIPDGKALVYIYRKSRIGGAAGRYLISANGEPAAFLPNGSYAPYFAPLGTNHFGATMKTKLMVTGVPMPSSLFSKDDLLSLVLRPGETYFVQFKIADSWGPKLVTMDRDVGTREITNCRLFDFRAPH
jgi:hypothetical protein